MEKPGFLHFQRVANRGSGPNQKKPVREDIRSVRFFPIKFRNLRQGAGEGPARNTWHGRCPPPNPQTARCRWFGQKDIGHNRLEVAQGIAVKPYFVRWIHKKLNGILMVQDRLGHFRGFFSCGLSPVNGHFHIEQRIGVSLRSAGVPVQAEQWPVQSLPGIGPCRLVIISGLADFCQPCFVTGGQNWKGQWTPGGQKNAPSLDGAPWSTAKGRQSS